MYAAIRRDRSRRGSMAYRVQAIAPIRAGPTRGGGKKPTRDPRPASKPAASLFAKIAQRWYRRRHRSQARGATNKQAEAPDRARASRMGRRAQNASSTPADRQKGRVYRPPSTRLCDSARKCNRSEQQGRCIHSNVASSRMSLQASFQKARCGHTDRQSILKFRVYNCRHRRRGFVGRTFLQVLLFLPDPWMRDIVLKFLILAVVLLPCVHRVAQPMVFATGNPKRTREPGRIDPAAVLWRRYSANDDDKIAKPSSAGCADRQRPRP